MRSWMIGMMGLVLAGPAWATTYFLSPTGNNGNDGLTAGTPKATLANVLGLNSSGTHTINMLTGTYTEYFAFGSGANNENLTIVAYNGPVTITYSASANSTLDSTTGMTAGSITIDGGDFGITFTHTGTAGNTASVVAQMRSVVACTLDGVTITGSGSQTAFSSNTGTRTGALVIQDCYFATGDAAGAGISIVNGGPVTIRGTTVDAYAQCIGMGTTAFTNVLVENNQFYSLTNRVVSQAGTPDYDSFIFRGNTIEDSAGGIVVPGTADPAITRIYNNTMEISHASAAYAGIELGLDAGPGSDPMGIVEVVNNTISQIGTDRAHCIVIGPNAEGAFVAGNTVSGGDFQLVFKANDLKSLRNAAYGPNPLLIAEGDRIVIEHNSCYSTSGPAFSYGENHTNNDPADNFICRNNIFDGGTGNYAFLDASGNNPNAVVDHNVYRAGASGLYYLNAANRGSLSLIQTQWASYSPLFAANDANSAVQTTAIMVNPASGDFRPRSTSVALTTGSASHADAGAVQHEEYVRRGNIYR